MQRFVLVVEETQRRFASLQQQTLVATGGERRCGAPAYVMQMGGKQGGSVGRVHVSAPLT
ncbi:MAG: hypothetical protein R3E75_00800 [Steroidobacteraceae bacterium]